MRISDFEDDFEYVILKRGLDYFEQGRVETLEFDGEEWIAEVFGSEYYTVRVQLADDNTVVDTWCNCPYDWSDYCKHQAAVFYKMRDDESINAVNVANVAKPKIEQSGEQIEDILKRLDKSTLIALLLEYADRDIDIKNDMLLHYSKDDKLEQKAKRVIRDSINRAKRRGFVEYGYTAQAVEGIYNVLEIAETLSEEKAISLCLVILKEALALLGYCDDSDGDVGDSIDNTIDVLSAACGSIYPESKDAEKVFSAIIKYVRSNNNSDWIDWQFNIARTCIPLCTTSNRRERLATVLEELAQSGESGHMDRFRVHEMQRIELELIERYDSEQVSDAYIEKHLENSDFREKAIEKALQTGRFNRALELCLDGEKLNAEYAGLVFRWRKMRYRVYTRMGDVSAQRKLAEELVAHGEFEYYSELKKLYKADEFNEVRDRLLTTLKSDRRFYDTYLQILEYENMKEKLLEYCRAHVSGIERFAKRLLPEYESETKDIYTQLIFERAQAASDRKLYRKLCLKVKELAGLFDKPTAERLRDELLSRYPNRPAFIDELKKLRF